MAQVATYPAFIIEGPASRLKKLALSCEGPVIGTSDSKSFISTLPAILDFQTKASERFPGMKLPPHTYAR
jgi:hypothetical protein